MSRILLATGNSLPHCPSLLLSRPASSVYRSDPSSKDTEAPKVGPECLVVTPVQVPTTYISLSRLFFLGRYQKLPLHEYSKQDKNTQRYTSAIHLLSSIARRAAVPDECAEERVPCEISPSSSVAGDRPVILLHGADAMMES